MVDTLMVNNVKFRELLENHEIVFCCSNFHYLFIRSKIARWVEYNEKHNYHQMYTMAYLPLFSKVPCTEGGPCTERGFVFSEVQEWLQSMVSGLPLLLLFTFSGSGKLTWWSRKGRKPLLNTRIATVSSKSFLSFFLFYFLFLGGRGTFISSSWRNNFLKCTRVVLQPMSQFIQTEKLSTMWKGRWRALVTETRVEPGAALTETPEAVRPRRDAHAPPRAQGRGAQRSRRGSTRRLPGPSRNQGPAPSRQSQTFWD